MSTRVITRSQAPALSRRVAPPVLFAVLMVMGSWIRVPLPGNPLPVTMQVVVVLLAGAVLSPAGAASSVALFLTAGMAGLPVFAGGSSGPAYMMGLSGGYLIGFVAGVTLEAWLLRDRNLGFWRVSAAMAAAVLTIHMLGALYMALYMGGAFSFAASSAAAFLPIDVLKIATAAGLVAGGASWKRRGAREN
ncbi:MAG: biotin transporter BioY [Candidatus Polarisedimenticolia bacterium]